MLLYGGTGQHVPEAIKGSFNLWLPVSSDAGWPSFTGVVLSDDDELAFPEASLWLLSCELAGSVKASWVELESESKTTSLSWLRSGKTNKEGGGKEKKEKKTRVMLPVAWPQTDNFSIWDKNGELFIFVSFCVQKGNSGEVIFHKDQVKILYSENFHNNSLYVTACCGCLFGIGGNVTNISCCNVGRRGGIYIFRRKKTTHEPEILISASHKERWSVFLSKTVFCFGF